MFICSLFYINLSLSLAYVKFNPSIRLLVNIYTNWDERDDSFSAEGSIYTRNNRIFSQLKVYLDHIVTLVRIVIYCPYYI